MNETNFSPKQQAKKENARISGTNEHSGGAPRSEEAAGQGSLGTHGGGAAEATELAGSPSPVIKSQRFPRAFRLRLHREFLTVQRKGRRYTVPHFVVITRTKSKAPSRLGITTSRKVGIAPARNRVRRLVREFFRRRVPLEQPCDVVVIARPGAATLTYAEVAVEIERALSSARSRHG